MIPYIPNFYTQDKADELFEFIKGQPFVRPANKRNSTSRLRRLSFPGYSPPLRGHHRSSEYSVSGSLDDAPELYKELASCIGAYANSQSLPTPINYLSTIGYLADDHMNFHQHREDKAREDQTVYVLSLGAVHPVAIREVGCEDESRWEIIYPAHGSLYVLPSSYNTTHEHAVLEGDDGSHNGLRIAINMKHIPVPPPLRITHGGHVGAGKARKFEDGTGPKIYSQRKGHEYPPDAVNVDRTTSFGNHNRRDLHTAEGRALWAADVTQKMQEPEFAARVEKLRGIASTSGRSMDGTFRPIGR
jgi:hypothetical protein